MSRITALVAVFAFVILMSPAYSEAGAAAAPAAQPEKKAFDWGGDIRLRSENFDDIPISAGGVTRGGENIYFRGRTRIWGQYSFSDLVLFKARIVNEFRSYQEGSGKNTWDWPDEWVLDNLYLDLTNLADGKFDLRIGRQDLIYGTGRVILEGNPLDGSRTIYFNAIKASIKWPKTVADILGIWNKAEDELAINSQHRDLVGLIGKYPTDMVETGGGVYLKNKSIEKMPLEAYYLFKNESDYKFTIPATATDPAVTVAQPDDLNLHTVGVRLMPQFSPSVSGNLELAGQLGERGSQDVSGWMVDGKLSYKFAATEKVNPAVSAGLYCLSGDDPDSEDDEGWNPLWARYPQHSELFVYAWDADGAGRWSNVTYPYVGLDVPFSAKVLLQLTGGYMWAPEEDGPGGESERGSMYTAWLKVKLNNTWSGHLLGEFVQPGDYYLVDDTAYFARLEMMCTF